jgi:catechol 2,3-dioxygenase-like lactoylglutathione lyase family enzyme
MPLQNLNHFLVLAEDLDATRDFYVDVLGLEVGKRPSFKIPGYWLYLGDHAVVHLASKDPSGAGESAGDGGTGAIDHIAFEASGLADMTARLEARGIPVRQRVVPGLGLHQLFIQDPNGVTIELNYPASEA